MVIYPFCLLYKSGFKCDLVDRVRRLLRGTLCETVKNRSTHINLPTGDEGPNIPPQQHFQNLPLCSILVHPARGTRNKVRGVNGKALHVYVYMACLWYGWCDMNPYIGNI